MLCYVRVLGTHHCLIENQNTPNCIRSSEDVEIETNAHFTFFLISLCQNVSLQKFLK
jgi:hypothetical protein